MLQVMRRVRALFEANSGGWDQMEQEVEELAHDLQRAADRAADSADEGTISVLHLEASDTGRGGRPRKILDKDALENFTTNLHYGTVEIAEICGCSSSHVRSELLRHGVRLPHASTWTDATLLQQVLEIKARQPNCGLACMTAPSRHWVRMFSRNVFVRHFYFPILLGRSTDPIEL